MNTTQILNQTGSRKVENNSLIGAERKACILSWRNSVALVKIDSSSKKPPFKKIKKDSRFSQNDSLTVVLTSDAQRLYSCFVCVFVYILTL